MTEGFNPLEMYNAALDVNQKAEDMAHKRVAVINRMYDAAIQNLGYSRKYLENNPMASKEIAKLMFSDEIAGDKNINTLLEDSPFYIKFAEAKTQDEKEQIHNAALGINYSTLAGEIDRGVRLTRSGLMNMTEENRDSYITSSIINFLNYHTGTSMNEQRDNYAALASLDPYISGLNPEQLDLNDARILALRSIRGGTSRGSLEDKVGVKVATPTALRRAA